MVSGSDAGGRMSAFGAIGVDILGEKVIVTNVCFCVVPDVA